MTTLRELNNRRGIDIETFLIVLILIFSTTIAISNILFFQAGGFSDSLTGARSVLYSRFIVSLLNIIYLVFYYLRRKIIHKSSLFIFLFILYTIFVSLTFYSPAVGVVVSNLFAWPLTYIVYYLYASKKSFPKLYRRCLVICCLLCCLFLINTLQTMSSGFTNVGPVYHAIAFLPMVLLLCNKKEKIVLSVLVSLFVIMTAKRAGFLTLITGFYGYFFLKNVQLRSKKKRIFSLAFLIIIVFLLYFIATDIFNLNVIERLRGASEDQGSGRLFIWNEVWQNFYYSPTINKFFGHGFYAVPSMIQPFGKGIFSHNSYLEFLYDLGIIGFGWLALFVFTMLKFLLRLVRENDALAPPASFAMCIILFYSSVSYFFEESNYIMLVISFWGAIQGIYKRKHIIYQG